MPFLINIFNILKALTTGILSLAALEISANLHLFFFASFLMMGMIGLILVGLLSFIWPAMMGGTFGTIVCFIGVLVFALFTAYDMQNLKRAYAVIGDESQKNQLAVLGALHLYISFIAMFQYLLSLFNRE